MRTFIAVELDPPLKDRLGELVRRLKRTGADVRWIGPEGMHLTLKFLGEVAESDAAAVEAVLKGAAAVHARFPLTLQGTGWFPPGPRPRVLWAGINDEPGLSALYLHLETELERLGYPRETREFHPHLTLGRVKGPSRMREVMAELEKDKETVFGSMTAAKMTFFESILKPDGAVYRPLAEVALL